MRVYFFIILEVQGVEVLVELGPVGLGLRHDSGYGDRDGDLEGLWESKTLPECDAEFFDESRRSREGCSRPLFILTSWSRIHPFMSILTFSYMARVAQSKVGV